MKRQCVQTVTNLRVQRLLSRTKSARNIDIFEYTSASKIIQASGYQCSVASTGWRSRDREKVYYLQQRLRDRIPTKLVWRTEEIGVPSIYPPIQGITKLKN